MRTFLILMMLLSMAPAWSLQIITIKTKDQIYKFHEKGKIRVSESCLKADCLALKKEKVKLVHKSANEIGNPAALFCVQEGGSYIVGVRESGDEDGLCQFKDKSFIISWDYYNNRIKK